MGKYLVIQEILIMNLLIVVVLFFTVSTVKAGTQACCSPAPTGDPGACNEDDNLCVYKKNSAGTVAVTCPEKGTHQTGQVTVASGTTTCWIKPSADTAKLGCDKLPYQCSPTQGTTNNNNSNNKNNNKNNNKKNSNNPSKGVSLATSVIFAISLEILICTIF